MTTATKTTATLEFTDLFNCSDQELDRVLLRNIANVDEAFVDHMRTAGNANFENGLSIKSSGDLLKMANLYARIGERLLNIYSAEDDVIAKFGVATFTQLVTRRFYLSQLELKLRGEALPTWKRLGFAAAISKWWTDVVEAAKPSRKPYLIRA